MLPVHLNCLSSIIQDVVITFLNLHQSAEVKFSEFDDRLYPSLQKPNITHKTRFGSITPSLFPTPIDRNIDSIQTAPWMTFTRANRMNVPYLPFLNSKEMAIRCRHFARSIQARKANVDVYNAVLNIHHIPTIHDFDGRRKAEGTR
jgi:hypothetical protein